MKVTQVSSGFRPITIVLESSEERAVLLSALALGRVTTGWNAPSRKMAETMYADIASKTNNS